MEALIISEHERIRKRMNSANGNGLEGGGKRRYFCSVLFFVRPGKEMEQRQTWKQLSWLGKYWSITYLPLEEGNVM
ncbi:hypothetical protein KSP40_PGU002879 [Platanthera guangdongensis]|uniref:Uncharacterized protein n=1 Tax=Platanthera guangdongensis TaxID=2320717 RepID=A0ABR2LFV0_9ASPA